MRTETSFVGAGERVYKSVAAREAVSNMKRRAMSSMAIPSCMYVDRFTVWVIEPLERTVRCKSSSFFVSYTSNVAASPAANSSWIGSHETFH